jgi:hypothetical protein
LKSLTKGQDSDSETESSKKKSKQNQSSGPSGADLLMAQRQSYISKGAKTGQKRGKAKKNEDWEGLLSSFREKIREAKDEESDVEMEGENKEKQTEVMVPFQGVVGDLDGDVSYLRVLSCIYEHVNIAL